MKISKRDAQETIAAALIFLYLYTGLSKYLSINAFQSVLNKSIVLQAYATLLSLALPGFEILLAVLLAVPRTRHIGFKISQYLLSLFTLYLLYMIKFSPKLPCSCGGIISQLSWTQHIILNVCLMIVSLYGAYLSRQIKMEKNFSTLLKHTVSQP